MKPVVSKEEKARLIDIVCRYMQQVDAMHTQILKQ